ncbi:hypothetical protein EV127DRAFT_98535 [Xylaria flabelliformis]|nr:hypothetical protein EV127DRAFT_98535 [Xylaria flabelliformis]
MKGLGASAWYIINCLGLTATLQLQISKKKKKKINNQLRAVVTRWSCVCLWYYLCSAERSAHARRPPSATQQHLKVHTLSSRLQP